QRVARADRGALRARGRLRDRARVRMADARRDRGVVAPAHERPVPQPRARLRRRRHAAHAALLGTLPAARRAVVPRFPASRAPRPRAPPGTRSPSGGPPRLSAGAGLVSVSSGLTRPAPPGGDGRAPHAALPSARSAWARGIWPRGQGGGPPPMTYAAIWFESL